MRNSARCDGSLSHSVVELKQPLATFRDKTTCGTGTAESQPKNSTRAALTRWPGSRRSNTRKDAATASCRRLRSATDSPSAIIARMSFRSSARSPRATRPSTTYFCSMMGPTWENRLFQLTGTTQLDEAGCDFPKDGRALVPSTIRDRDLRPRARGWAGRRAITTMPMPDDRALRKPEVRRASLIPIEQFWLDAREGKLANVVFVDPELHRSRRGHGYLERLPPLGQRPGGGGFRRAGPRCPEEEPAVGPHGVRAQLRRARRILRSCAAAGVPGRYGAAGTRAASRI